MSSPEEPNPYAVGEASTVSGDDPWSHEETQRALASLGRWQAIFSVLLMAGCGLATLATAVSVVLDDPGDLAGLVGGLACLGAMAFVFYVLPAVLLWRAAQASRALARSMSPTALYQFARSQQVFWFWLGILLIIVLAFYGLLLGGLAIWALL